jgi:DegV family protein with EDD domain
MTKIVLATDSCSDLSQPQVKAMGLKIIPLSLTMEGKTYFHFPDERELKISDFYQALRDEKVATTSLINSAQFVNFFEPILKEGNDVLYIGFSSALSGTYQSSVLAAEQLKETYPKRSIVTIDSLSASTGQGLLVMKAFELLKKNETLDQLKIHLEQYKFKICHLFTVADLGTLKRGGRLSNAQAFVGTLLKLKPILHVSNEGKLVALQKVRGRRSSLETMVDLVGERITKPKDQTIIIAHGDTLEEAEQVGKMIQDRYQVKDIIYNIIGPVIGAHSGPGTIAVYFEGDHR